MTVHRWTPEEGVLELLVPISLRVEVECKVITNSVGDSVDVTIAACCQ